MNSDSASSAVTGSARVRFSWMSAPASIAAWYRASFAWHSWMICRAWTMLLGAWVFLCRCQDVDGGLDPVRRELVGEPCCRQIINRLRDVDRGGPARVRLTTAAALPVD